MTKLHFSANESIPIILYFHNIGDKTILLDGILPDRTSAGPPIIEVWPSDSIRYQINDIKENLLNDNSIRIEPGKKLISE